MSRNVQIVLLCEDRQHESFGRRFLEKAGWTKRQIRVERAPKGRGAGEQFVRIRFPRELAEYRRRMHHVSVALLVMVDGDSHGVERRIEELNAACRERDIPCREPGEKVLVFVPTWQIETWLAYLGGETVDEEKPDYPRLPRPRECRPHVNSLAAMCRSGGLRQPAPSSLVTACTEYRRWFGAMPGN